MIDGEMAALNSTRPHGIMFHHFHGGSHLPTQGSIDAETLCKLIDQVGREHILNADEWFARAENNALQPKDVCLTFDDALRCQLDVALPVLQKLGITAFWFVHTSMLTGEPSRLEIYRRFRDQCFDSLIQFYSLFEDRARDIYGPPELQE